MFMSRRVTKMTLIGLTFAVGATATAAQAGGYPKEMENDLIAVCEAVKSDSRLKLDRAVKATGLSMRDLHEGLVCNSEDMITFALTHNATKNGALIARRVSAEPSVLTAKR